MTQTIVNPTSTSSSLSSTPPRPLLLQNLISQSQTLQTLFTHLSSPTPQIQPISALYTTLYSQTSELSSLIDEVYEHQEAYAVLMDKKEEVKVLERRVRSELKGLERGLRDLEGEVKEGKKVRESIERSENAPLSSSTLLSVAQNLASHTSAPLSSLLLPQDKAQYMPWPTEGAMRAGLLFTMGGSMSGVGDTGKIGDQSKDAHKMDVDTALQAQIQPVHEEDTRRYDPDAVFQLDLNSDSEEDD